MKRILILRHAKSSWTDPNLSDLERPLNERGLRTAPFMGKLIVERGLSPAAIISSPAKRARQTAELVVNEIGVETNLSFDDRIYEASPNALRIVVSETSNDLTSVMIVGHNPGIEGFIRHLTGKIESMPTAALAVIDLNIESWKEINHDTGSLITIIRPKEEIPSVGGAAA